MKKRFHTELQGNTLLITFTCIPSHGVREILHEFGYKYYHASRTWVGTKRKDEIIETLKEWNQHCNALSKRSDTLCWSCANACGWCDWSRKPDPKPVEGWKAIQHDVQGEESYYVMECPKYVPDKPRKGVFDGGFIPTLG